MKTDRITELRALITAERVADGAHRQAPGPGKWTAWQCAEIDLRDAAAESLPALLDCAEALQGLVAYARDSQGIAGYHMNGAILEWDDVEELHAGMNALARLNGDNHA